MTHTMHSPGLYKTSWLAVWSLGWLVVLFAGMVAVLALHSAVVVAIALPVFLLSILVLLPLAFLFRCPSCRRRLLVQGWSSLHPSRKRLPFGVASWLAVAFDITRHRKFTCMHCGEGCSVRI